MATQAMTLGQALDRIEALDEDLVIFAKKPWTADSEAMVGSFGPGSSVPKSMVDQGFAYFIEVHAAIEALAVFGDRNPTEAERRRMLLYYGEFDAFPAWVYESQ